MNGEILQNFLDESASAFENYKKLAEGALKQVSDEEFFKMIDSQSNSIAIIVKHLGGNLRSRWTDFLTTDGEKPARNRDGEFLAQTDSRESLMNLWETGWQAAVETLRFLTIEDLAKTVKIRGEEFTVAKAIMRSVAHTAYHVGQIAFLAKHFRENNWKTLSIPKNKSAQFNEYLSRKDEKGNYLEAAGEFAENQ